jgi:hypothetical protein
MTEPPDYACMFFSVWVNMLYIHLFSVILIQEAVMR